MSKEDRVMSKFRSVKITLSKGTHRIIKREPLNGLEYNSEKDAMSVSRVYWSQFIEDNDNVWYYDDKGDYTDQWGTHTAYMVGMRSGYIYFFGVEEIWE